MYLTYVYICAIYVCVLRRTTLSWRHSVAFSEFSTRLVLKIVGVGDFLAQHLVWNFLELQGHKLHFPGCSVRLGGAVPWVKDYGSLEHRISWFFIVSFWIDLVFFLPSHRLCPNFVAI